MRSHQGIGSVSSFAGKLQLTRMGFRRGCYTVDGYPLRDGLRAAIGG
jgi:hypothetical protein